MDLEDVSLFAPKLNGCWEDQNRGSNRRAATEIGMSTLEASKVASAHARARLGSGALLFNTNCMNITSTFYLLGYFKFMSKH